MVSVFTAPYDSLQPMLTIDCITIKIPKACGLVFSPYHMIRYIRITNINNASGHRIFYCNLP